MKYTIDRSKWVCALKGVSYTSRIFAIGPSHLLNRQGRMCCLGQVCKSHGVNDDDLNGSLYPSELTEGWERYLAPDWLMNGSESSITAKRMMDVNDCTEINQAEREKKLKALARKAGHTLEFKGRLIPLKAN